MNFMMFGLILTVPKYSGTTCRNSWKSLWCSDTCRMRLARYHASIALRYVGSRRKARHDPGVPLHVRPEPAVHQAPALPYYGHRHGRRRPAWDAAAPGKAQGGPWEGIFLRFFLALCPCAISLWF